MAYLGLWCCVVVLGLWPVVIIKVVGLGAGSKGVSSRLLVVESFRKTCHTRESKGIVTVLLMSVFCTHLRFHEVLCSSVVECRCVESMVVINSVSQRSYHNKTDTIGLTRPGRIR